MRRIRIQSVVLWLTVFLPLPVAGAPPNGSEPAASTNRAEQRFVLFQPDATGPASVPASAQERLAAAPPGYETLYARWVRMNAVDPSDAAPGDRVVFHVSPGEAFELIISSVQDASNGESTFWSARFPDYSYDTVSITFSRDAPGHTATLYGASFQIPEQSRHIVVQAAAELPGWALLMEIMPRADLAPKGSDLYVIDEKATPK